MSTMTRSGAWQLTGRYGAVAAAVAESLTLDPQMRRQRELTRNGTGIFISNHIPQRHTSSKETLSPNLSQTVHQLGSKHSNI